jgi:hypothetical protein
MKCVGFPHALRQDFDRSFGSRMKHLFDQGLVSAERRVARSHNGSNSPVPGRIGYVSQTPQACHLPPPRFTVMNRTPIGGDTTHLEHIKNIVKSYFQESEIIFHPQYVKYYASRAASHFKHPLFAYELNSANTCTMSGCNSKQTSSGIYNKMHWHRDSVTEKFGNCAPLKSIEQPFYSSCRSVTTTTARSIENQKYRVGTKYVAATKTIMNRATYGRPNNAAAMAAA